MRNKAGNPAAAPPAIVQRGPVLRGLLNVFGGTGRQHGGAVSEVGLRSVSGSSTPSPASTKKKRNKKKPISKHVFTDHTH
uniref:Uncharacterized protein n=1 Tax=Anguilla anguilla TaxID=7936 RepID=A0A0E9WFA8_ANGAN